MKYFKDKATLLDEVAILVAQGKNVSYRPATECVDGFIGWILFL